MIISHKYRFIFLKTRKTAGTSIELWLSQHCADSDIVTPVEPEEAGHVPRNHQGIFDPLRELAQSLYSPDKVVHSARRTLGDLVRRRRFYNHIPGRLVQARILSRIWRSYWKWCVERAPGEKIISDFYMQRAAYPGLSLEEYLSTYPPPVNYPIYCNSGYKPIVDQFIDYAQLQSQLRDLASKLHITFQGLEHKAKSKYKPGNVEIDAILSASARRIIKERFAVERSIVGRFNGI